MLPMRGHRGQNTIMKLNPARGSYVSVMTDNPALTDTVTDVRMLLTLSQMKPAPLRPFSAHGHLCPFRLLSGRTSSPNWTRRSRRGRDGRGQEKNLLTLLYCN